MSEAEFKAAKVEGPKAPLTAAAGGTNLNRRLLVLPITTSSAVFDILGDLAQPQPLTNGYTNAAQLPMARTRYVKMTASVDTYYAWSDTDTGSVDETDEQATTPETQADILPAGIPTHEFPSGRYLIIKGSAAGRLRISVSSP